MAANSLNDLMDIAIDAERKAQKLYLDAREKTADDQIRHFLYTMAEQEKNHERVLKSVKEMEIYDGSILVEVAALVDTKEAHTVGEEENIPEMPLEEIFEIALKREKKAFTLYDQMALSSNNDDLKKLFLNLADEERIHFKNIEKKYLANTGQMGYEG
jgi:rubrerythrin